MTGAVRRLFPISERACHEIELILALVDVEAAVLLAAVHGRLLVVLVRVNGVVGVLFIRSALKLIFIPVTSLE